MTAPGRSERRRIDGSTAAAVGKVCDIADRAGYDIPMHVAQDMVNAVAEEVATAGTGNPGRFEIRRDSRRRIRETR